MSKSKITITTSSAIVSYEAEVDDHYDFLESEIGDRDDVIEVEIDGVPYAHDHIGWTSI